MSSTESNTNTELFYHFGELSLWFLVIVAVVTILVVPAVVVMSTRQTCHRDDISLRPKLPGDRQTRSSEKTVSSCLAQATALK